MKGKLTFLVIESRTGRRRRFSVSRNFIVCMALMCLTLLGTGIWGVLKYNENLELKKRCQVLEVEKNKFEAVSRTVQSIEKDADGVRKLLGLQTGGDSAQESGTPTPEPASR